MQMRVPLKSQEVTQEVHSHHRPRIRSPYTEGLMQGVQIVNRVKWVLVPLQILVHVPGMLVLV